MRHEQAFATSHSLLVRLGHLPADPRAWAEFTHRYQPLIRRFCLRRGLDAVDAQDVSQDVLARLVRAMRTFRYDPRGGFRRWLYTVCRNALHDHRRKARRPGRGTGDSLVAKILANQPAPESASRSRSDEYERELFGLALSRVRARVAEHNWKAFELSVLEGRSVEETAGTLGLHAGMIYVARCKITKMLRQEILRLQDRSDAVHPERVRDEHESLSRAR